MMNNQIRPDEIEAARAEGIALGIQRRGSALALYVLDILHKTFERYRREGCDSILIDDAKTEVYLCIARAFKRLPKHDANGEAEGPAEN